MGRELHDAFPSARGVFEEADRVLGYLLSETCFQQPPADPKEAVRDINKTIYTQPTLYTTGYACFKALVDACAKAAIPFDFKYVAGHSLGEYTALVAAGAIDFASCLLLVKERATNMTEVGKTFPEAGLMAVVDRRADLDYALIESLCQKHGLYITLKNTKRQLVVGGLNTRLAEMAQELKKLGKTTTVLKVEGPFHTPMMKPAADRLKDRLDKTDFTRAQRGIIANVSAEPIFEAEEIRDELYKQIFQIVNWRGSIEKAAALGTDLFIEIGPKKVLSNMLKDIAPDIPQINVEDMASLENALAVLSGA
jgi:[acyl-carrier-protein] S-malonyltransferase